MDRELVMGARRSARRGNAAPKGSAVDSAGGLRESRGCARVFGGGETNASVYPTSTGADAAVVRCVPGTRGGARTKVKDRGGAGRATFLDRFGGLQRAVAPAQRR
jgi:hypothetical protein